MPSARVYSARPAAPLQLVVARGGAVGVQVGEQPGGDMPELPGVQPARLGHQGGLDLLGEVFAAAQRGLFGLGRDGVDGRADQPGVRRVELAGGQRGAHRGEDRGQRFAGQPAPRR